MRKNVLKGVQVYGEERMNELRTQSAVVLNELVEKNLVLSSTLKEFNGDVLKSVQCKLQLPEGRKVTLKFEVDTRGDVRHGPHVFKVTVKHHPCDDVRQYTFTRSVEKGLAGMTEKVMKLVNYNLAYQDKCRAEGQARSMANKAA